MGRSARRAGSPRAHRPHSAGAHSSCRGHRPPRASEALGGHRRRWGGPPPHDGAQVRALLRDSRLDGRGGAGFPLGRKVETARLAPGRPVLIVNASESEPESRKDRTLCRHRPHLVLDGAALLARSLGVDEVVLHAHRGPGSPIGPLSLAVVERVRAGEPDPAWQLSEGPDRYVAGESSAVVSFVDHGEARPRFATHPLAVVRSVGPAHGRRQRRDAHPALGRRPDRRGGLERPGCAVVPRTAPGHAGRRRAPSGSGLGTHGPGHHGRPPGRGRAGGGAGRRSGRRVRRDLGAGRRGVADARSPGSPSAAWGPRPDADCSVSSRTTPARWGRPPGSSATWPANRPASAAPASPGCPGWPTGWRPWPPARPVDGPIGKLSALADAVFGSGACAHPDGVVRLVRSTLGVFGDDVVRHLGGGPCRGSDHPPVLAVPGARTSTATDGAAWR